MNIICVLRGHVPYLDYSQCIRPEPDVIVGPVRRYCGRCSQTLPGDAPQVGDKRGKDALLSLPESYN